MMIIVILINIVGLKLIWFVSLLLSGFKIDKKIVLGIRFILDIKGFIFSIF